MPLSKTANLGVMVAVLVLCSAGGVAALRSGESWATRPVEPGVPSGTVLYVSPQGKDTWSGRLAEPRADGTDGPLASLAAARAAVRRLKAKGLTRPITVVVRGGVYELSEPLNLTPQDSGTATCPITYMAAPGETVVLRGGRKVRGWERWRKGIYRADLKAQGLGGVRFHQLFYRGRRQVLARFPNLDPKHPRTGGQLYVDDASVRPRAQFYYAAGEIPFEQWGDYSQAEIVSTYAGGWNFALSPITSVDTKQCLITFRQVRNTFRVMNRYFIQNVLGALDAPGEWYLDYKTSLLYFWPPDDQAPGDEVVVPILDYIVHLKGTLPYPHGYLRVSFHGSREEYKMPEGAPPENPVHHVILKGFRLEAARHSGIYMSGARACSVIACQVTNIGNYGINLGGVTNAYPEEGIPRLAEPEGEKGGVAGAGQDLYFNDPCVDCRVAGNDLWSLGADGIFLYGTGNVAENNHAYDTGLWNKDTACVNLWGERNVARRNTLHDVPRNAIFLKGVDNLVELNDLRYTMLETCDGGAIRMCQRNLRLRGNIIRHNLLLDTVGYGFPRGSGAYQSPYFSWGVYLDDFTCGTLVQGNIIARTGRGGVMIHGGSDNIVDNNIIVDAGNYLIEHAPIRTSEVKGNRAEHNILVGDGNRTVIYRAWRPIQEQLSLGSNLIWTRGKPVQVSVGGHNYKTWQEWQAAGLDKGSIVADPRFVNASADDYRLRQDSPAWKLGFKRIPVERIGCYRSPERATWPLLTASYLVREKPVLYTRPLRPLHEDFERDAPGRKPRHGDVISYPKAPVVVTAERASAGKHSLKIQDAPGLPHVWEPRIFWPFSYRDGTVRFSCDLWLDPQHPPKLYLDPRQYSDTGGAEYFSGPTVHIEPDGRLMAHGEELARVPLGEWFTLEITMTLGPQAPDSSPAVLAVRGQAPVRLTISHGSPKFQRLERVVLSSLADAETVFYVDEVVCDKIKE